MSDEIVVKVPEHIIRPPSYEDELLRAGLPNKIILSAEKAQQQEYAELEKQFPATVQYLSNPPQETHSDFNSVSLVAFPVALLVVLAFFVGRWSRQFK